MTNAPLAQISRKAALPTVLPPTRSAAEAPPSPLPAPAPQPAISLKGTPPRSAWVEIDLARLRRNFELIAAGKPADVQLLSVVKDNGYGHGAAQVARAALEVGATFLALGTVEEAVQLRDRGFEGRLLLLGERQESELPWCLGLNLTCCVSDPHIIQNLARLARQAGRCVPVHLKINTGMNRYGVRWDTAHQAAAGIAAHDNLLLEGTLTHFSQSDELDKTFARLQLSRYQEAMRAIDQLGIPVRLRHLCNSGGFVDLPEAHYDMVRLGILPLGVYPSSVCRRIPGLLPVMSVKARIVSIQHLQPGDVVGYGMRYKAETPRRIAVLPIGYGDGFPRVRNQGFALVRGRRAPLVGGVAMDALTIDITDIPEAGMWDEAVLMGTQGGEQIDIHEVARLKNSVSYDILANWRARLPRIYLNEDAVT
jgi:alanine racemase